MEKKKKNSFLKGCLSVPGFLPPPLVFYLCLFMPIGIGAARKKMNTQWACMALSFMEWKIALFEMISLIFTSTRFLYLTV